MFVYKNKEYENVWFTSDEHYGSDRHILLSKRLEFSEDIAIAEIKSKYATTTPVFPLPKHIERAIKNSRFGNKSDTRASIVNMNNKFIENHNLLVGKNDLVFHIGDFGDFSYSNKLNGDHILIMGNYEYDDCMKNYDGNIPVYIDMLTTQYNFIDVLDNYTFDLSKTDQNIIGPYNEEIGQIYITHKPENCIWISDIETGKYVPDIMPNDKYIMNLFGHIHEKSKIKRFGLNVGIDCHHYYPVSQGDVAFYLYAIFHYYDENVFM